MIRIRLAVVPALLALAGCTVTDAVSPVPSDSPSSSARSTPVLPDPGPPCTLLVAGEEVGLTVAEAVTLTALAAEALSEGLKPRGLAARLGALPDEAPRRPAARALLGYAGPALTCEHDNQLLRDQKVGSTGLTRRAERLRRAIRTAFGDLPMGGFAAGGVDTGHLDNSSHYEGRAMDVFFRPHTDRSQARRGWVLAQWLVARGDALQVLSVIYRDHIWTVWASFVGWRDYEHPSGNTTDPVLRHLDHVHTAVIGGPHREDRD